MSIEIKKVESRKEMRKFVKFPLKLYKNHPCFIPALSFDELNTFNPKLNPAFEFCESECFIAIKDDEVVGRIAMIINSDANRCWKEEHARFGWFDVIDDINVTKALMDRAEQWAKERGMNAVKGPMGFTDLDHQGMLVNGFDKVGTFATIYNYQYYPLHLEQLGFVKDVDWKEFKIIMPDSVPDRFTRMAAIVSEKHGLRMAKFKSNKELVDRYGKKLFQLWNDTYKVLYGFAPITDRQVKYYIKLYLSVVKWELVSLIVDKEDDLVGFGIAIPSLSRAFQKAKGKLFPFGIFHLMKALKKNDLVDLYLMGVRLDYQGKGLNSMIFSDLVPKFIKNGYKIAETNPELEDNGKIQALWSEFGPLHIKSRRVYLKEIK